MTLYSPSEGSALRLALFDFDGTLCDSGEQIISALKKAGREVGVMDINEMQARQSIGQGLHHLALTLTNNDIDKAFDENINKFESSFGEIKNFKKELMPISFGPTGEA